MKKLLLLLATICFISCECPYCGEKNCRCGDDGPYGIHYDYDYFCAEKLLGEWQATYGCQVGNLELKDIKFFDGWRCDITMTQVRNTGTLRHGHTLIMAIPSSSQETMVEQPFHLK